MHGGGCDKVHCATIKPFNYTCIIKSRCGQSRRVRFHSSLLFPSLSPPLLSLLKEAEIHAEQREFELNRRRQMGLSSSHHSLDNIEFDNKEDDQHDQRLLSQFGIWFLVGNHRRLPRLTGDKTVHVCAQSYLC